MSILRGVKQGCLASMLIFGVAIGCLLRYMVLSVDDKGNLVAPDDVMDKAVLDMKVQLRRIKICCGRVAP